MTMYAFSEKMRIKQELTLQNKIILSIDGELPVCIQLQIWKLKAIESTGRK